MHGWLTDCLNQYKMKRLALVIPCLGLGGMERVMAELATYFVQDPEIEVHLVIYGMNRDIFYHIPSNVIVHKPYFEFNNQKRAWYSLKTLYFIRRTVKALKPDSILSFGEYWNSFILLALYRLPFPIFISDRCQPDKTYGLVHNMLRQWLYPKAKGIITQTKKAENHYREIFKQSNIQTIGNPIRFINVNPEIKKENIVLTVGRLIKSKHHDELIRLFVSINKPDWKLIVVGGDALKQNNFERLQILIKELDAHNKVVLIGKSQDVDQYYLMSKIFAFTSSSEGFPNVIGEAMSAGLPVVAFDCMAGPSDMIRDEINGYLVPLFDYKIFKEKLLILMDSVELRDEFGYNGKESIHKYSVNLIGKGYYNFILGAPKKAKI